MPYGSIGRKAVRSRSRHVEITAPWIAAGVALSPESVVHFTGAGPRALRVQSENGREHHVGHARGHAECRACESEWLEANGRVTHR